MERSYQHARNYCSSPDSGRREDRFRWERSRSRDTYRQRDDFYRDYSSPSPRSPVPSRPAYSRPYSNRPNNQSPYSNHPNNQSPYPNRPNSRGPYPNRPNAQSSYSNRPNEQSPYYRPNSTAFSYRPKDTQASYRPQSRDSSYRPNDRYDQPQSGFRPASSFAWEKESALIKDAHPNLLKTLSRHRASQEHKPQVTGLLPREVCELVSAQLELKSFLLKLAVDIDKYFLDHHNQLSHDTKVKMCRTQEPVNTREMVGIYHFVLHVEEGRGAVHALDVLEYGTKECPYALRICHQMDH